MPVNVQVTRPQSNSGIITLKPAEDKDLANPDTQLFNLFAHVTIPDEQIDNNILTNTAPDGLIFPEDDRLAPISEITKPPVGINPPKPPEFIRPIEPPIRIDPNLQKIKQLTERLKAMFKQIYNPGRDPRILLGEGNFSKPAWIPQPDYLLEELYKALNAYTGKEITNNMKEGIKEFFKAAVKNKPADTNSDGKNDFNDILTIVEKGYFDPIAWSPDEDNQGNNDEVVIQPYPLLRENKPNTISESILDKLAI